MQVSGEDVQIRIPFPEALEVFIQCRLGLFSDLCSRSRIIPVADLDDQLMEGFFLLAGTDLFIVVFDPSVSACLLFVVPFQGFIEELVIDLLDRFVTVFYIEVGALRVHVCRLEFPAVVIDGAFPDLSADRSYHFKSHPFLALRKQRPLLLSAKVTQKHF